MIKRQKYHKGDHVKVAKDLGSTMSHFKNDCEAIVISSYKDAFGGSNISSYTLFIKDSGECAWYEEEQLTLISKREIKLLNKWMDKEKEETDKYYLNPKISGGKVQKVILNDLLQGIEYIYECAEEADDEEEELRIVNTKLEYLLDYLFDKGRD